MKQWIKSMLNELLSPRCRDGSLQNIGLLIILKALELIKVRQVLSKVTVHVLEVGDERMHPNTTRFT